MACMVLPSETARLVYGYLVKEKLDSIALQFLENSPYLTDCYHIVKSGYQFNTKFLYKELHELIQEYSTIQNLVNKKIGLLSKKSALYKRIKLQCDNLSEMIDLILFWRYSETKSKEDSPVANSKVITLQTENKTDRIIETSVNKSNNNISIPEPNCNGSINSISQKNDDEDEESQITVFEESDCRMENKILEKNDTADMTVNYVVENSVNDLNNDFGACKKLPEIQGQGQSNISEVSKVRTNEINVQMNNMEQGCADKNNEIEILIPNEPEVVNIDGQIKIVRIEKDSQENVDKNQLTNTFAQNLDSIESGMNIDNGSVLYVTPDVGNIMNQERNQIIVIPIDYYKTQNDLGTGNTQTQNIAGNITNNIGASNGIIFEDVSITPNSMPVTTSSTTLSCTSAEKKTFVDDNIVTEGTFLKNRELLYELENKIKPQILHEPVPVKEIAPPPVPATSTIIVTQLIEQPEIGRHRRILPKKELPVQNPVVVVQPLVEKKTVVTTSKSLVMKKKGASRKKVKVSPVKETKEIVVEEVREVLNMPSIRTPAQMKEKPREVNEADGKVDDSQNKTEKLNEEKENRETTENKIDTPIIIVKKNSKRLSLSTPRRRSHIRALEFETPPKTGSENKKSKTSPKVKVDEVKVKNKNVRNTLFKSPDLDTTFKTPTCLAAEKKAAVCENAMLTKTTEPANVTIPPPIDATPSKTKTSEAWDNANAIGCSMGNTEKKPSLKKSWDSDLRDFISATLPADKTDSNEKKRTRKQKKGQKDDKKTSKKQSSSPKKVKPSQAITSPSKLNLTAKRNTYSISGNEDGSPVRSLFEELDLVTPFKDSDGIRPSEETPLTKFFRESVNGLDIDFNMINTPIFPPTPSIVITPDVEDSLSMAGAYYYSPLKDAAKDKTSKAEGFKSELVKIDEYIRNAESENNRKQGAKETHEKVIGELVSKAKEIVGLRRADSEESAIKKPPSGKVLSMVKIQMITQCDKKLYENIPINEESVNESTNEHTPLIDKITEEAAKFDLKCELEEKRQRALKKIKSVKENFAVSAKRKKAKSSPIKRRRRLDARKPGKKAKKDSLNESSVSDGKTNESSGSIADEVEIFHSTPYTDRSQKSASDKEDSLERVDRSMLEEIREEFPPFQDDSDLPELPVKTRKKLHYIKHFLKSVDIVRYLESCSEQKSPKLRLKRSHRKFFQVFYKWLRHPHSREVNTSERTKNLFKEYRTLFEKIKAGVSFKLSEEGGAGKEKEDALSACAGGQCQLSDDEGEVRQKTSTKKKEDDVDDGPVSILPLKKRKATVQPLEAMRGESSALPNEKAPAAENPSRTQTFLQDIDVDRFLSQIHGQENR